VQFTDWNVVSSIGGFVYGVSQLLFVYVIWRCARVAAPAGNRAWEGARGTGMGTELAAAASFLGDGPSRNCGRAGSRALKETEFVG
jgi:heme/copper-type cytochrome/quinol oxidase subunit 1